MPNDEEDEEVQSFFQPTPTSDKSDHLNDSEIFYDTASDIDKTTKKFESVDINGPSTTSPSRRFSHKRASHLTHSRSESLPVASKVPHILPTRHDRVRHFAQSPLYKFAKIRIKQDPFLSPLHASNELLAKLPSTYLVVSSLS